MTSFDEVWQTLVPQLSGYLARRGVPATERDDVLQETAIRLYRNWGRFDHDRPILPLARRVASNVWLNMCDLSASRHEVSTGQLPDRPAAVDVEEACAAKAELGRVVAMVRRLRTTDQRAIHGIVADEFGTIEPTSLDPATRVARHRARQRLSAALRYAGALVAMVIGGLRSVRRGYGTWATAGLAAAGLGVLLVPGSAAVMAQPRLSIPVVQDVGVRTVPASAAAIPPARVSAVRPHTAAVSAASARKAPYWTVGDDQPVGAGVQFDADLDVIGARTTPTGSTVPVCVYGPDAPDVDRCPDAATPARPRP